LIESSEQIIVFNILANAGSKSLCGQRYSPWLMDDGVNWHSANLFSWPEFVELGGELRESA
jgi:hypothetical protein